MKALNFHKRIVWTLCLMCAGSVSAQKLPSIQESSQWIPATGQIDGKLTEWNGLLQAYNRAILVEYTIANDNKNLYLAIRSKYNTATAKILVGGISFILNTSGKNSESENAIVTVPATNSFYYYNKEGLVRNFKILSDSAAILNEIVKLKEIKTKRLIGVSDSIISFYNEYGIKTRLAYTNETLICELSIPFDRIGLSEKESVAFAYTIRLNGVPPPPSRQPPPTGPFAVVPGAVSEREIKIPTYFSGKYTLAKKP